MKHLLLNFKKDWTIGFRTHYLWITLATVVIFFLFIRFLLPDSYQEITVYQYIDPAYDSIPGLQEALAEGESDGELVIRVEKREEVYAKMKEDPSSYGFIIEKDPAHAKPEITIVSPGSAEGKWAQLVELQMNIGLSMGINAVMEENPGGYPTDFTTRILYPELQDLAYRDTFLPAFLVMESALLGMFLLSVMLFAEKDQRMHTAYMISPGGLSEHLLSKALVMMALGLISSFSMTLLLRGFSANYWLLLVIMLASSFLGSAIGLVLGAFFNSLQKAMMIVFAVFFILLLPMISYMFPNFTPLWVTFLPTYTMLFAVRDAVIPAFGSAGVYRGALLLTGEGIVLFIIARLAYERILWKNS